MKFDGVHEFSRPANEVWEKLTDARFLAACLPDLETIKEADADRAVCVLRPGFSFARGVLDLTVHFSERVSASSARVVMDAKGIGSSSTVEASFTLEPTESGCRMAWNAAVTKLGGLLKAVPQGLLTGAAKKVLEQAWANVQTRIDATPTV